MVRAVISETKNLDVLCLGHPIDDQDTVSQIEDNAVGSSPRYRLPSWVPDFGKSMLLANPHVYRYRKDPYKASGDTYPPTVKVSEEAEQGKKDTLSLTGIFLDKLTAINPAKTRDRRKFEDLQSLVRSIEEIKSFDRVMWASHGNTVSFAYKEHGPSTGYDGIGNWLISRPQPPSVSSPPGHVVGEELLSEHQTVLQEEPGQNAAVGHDFPAVMVCLAGYVFATTTKGLQCMVPEHSKPGDALYILYGSRVPHVLREVGVDHSGNDGRRPQSLSLDRHSVRSRPHARGSPQASRRGSSGRAESPARVEMLVQKQR